MKVLQVIQSAYRCTLEEQDDPAVWITHAMKGAGAELDVLLRGNAVNYTLRGQDASGLSFGEVAQTQPPRLDRDIASLVNKGVNVYVVAEDMIERGIDSVNHVEGIQHIKRSGMANLFSDYDQIWHW